MGQTSDPGFDPFWRKNRAILRFRLTFDKIELVNKFEFAKEDFVWVLLLVRFL